MKQFWDLIQESLGPNFAEDQDLQEMILELSHAFTEGREELPRDYLGDPEIERAYLAYYVPLNFFKVELILTSHAGVWPKELTGPQRWVDLGCGPGTAALAALAAYRNRYKKLAPKGADSNGALPPVHIDLVDTMASTVQTAAALVEQFAGKLGVQVSTGMHTSLAGAVNASKGAKYDLGLAANVLNELPPEGGRAGRELMMQLWDATSGVLLVVEPGHRVSSQRLVRFRERLLKETAPGPDGAKILAPCTHAEGCPVNRTKHWCHFSEPSTDGRLIDLNLRVFKNPRGWLKFSYLLVRRGEMAEWDKKTYRAIGDLHISGGPKKMAIDLCQPETKFALRVPANLPPELRSNLVRGARVTVEDDYEIEARPLTKREVKVFEPRAKDAKKPPRSERPPRHFRPARGGPPSVKPLVTPKKK